MNWSFLKVPEEKKICIDQFTEHILKFRKGLSKTTEWKDVLLFPGFNAELAKKVYKDWDGFNEGDVIIASYPKTGTHWVAEIVATILEYSPGQTSRTEHHHKLIPLFLSFGPTSKTDLFPYVPYKRVPYSTHLPATLVNMEKVKQSKAKVICVLRNPKDQAVSWYNFVRTLPMEEEFRNLFPDEWEEFLRLYMSGKHPLFVKRGEFYPDHVLTWYKHKNEKHVKFIYFEDLKRNINYEIKTLAEFLEVELLESEVSDVADKSSFHTMKSRDDIRLDDLISNDHKTYRKGQVGEWKNYFTVAQSETMDEIMKSKLEETDIKFTYEL